MASFSLSASRIKFIRSLSRKKEREESGLFVVEGEKMVNEAIVSGYRVREIYRRDEIGLPTMERISSLSSPPPVLALVEQKTGEDYTSQQWIENLARKKTPLVLALENIKDPGNMGTIIRVAEWFGVDVVYLSEECVEIYNPKVVQATMGAIFRQKVALCRPLCEVIRRCKACGLPVFATSLHGENIYAATESLTKGVVIMGNESAGISDEMAAEAQRLLLIPSFQTSGHGSESLNVATATAVVCAEFRREFFASQPRTTR